MGSIQSYEKCPVCGLSNCFTDLYYKTGEVYRICLDCGYYYSSFFKRNKDGNIVKKNKDKDLTYDNVVLEEEEILNPYGTYCVKSDEGGEVGTLSSKEEYNEFVSEIVSLTNQPNDITKATVSRLVEGEIEKETIFETNEGGELHED